MTDLDTITTWLTAKEKLAIQLAPSFVVDFDPVQLIPALRFLSPIRLTELTHGITTTNRRIQMLINQQPHRTYIAGACPIVTAYIKNQYPAYIDHLVPGFSPMAAQTKINHRLWPDHKHIFIGPCPAKKTEAQNVTNLDLVLTFQELRHLLTVKNIDLSQFSDPDYTFDTPSNTQYRQYPLTGALKPTLDEKSTADWKIISVELIPEIKKVWEKYQDQTEKTILIDALACPGGCIGGPGVISQKPTSQKRRTILRYTSQAGDHSAC